MSARIFAALTSIALARVLGWRPSSFSLPQAPRAPTLRLLACGMAGLAAAGAAAANEADAAAVLRLRQGGEVSCQPTLPYFCENMHVRCSSQTSVPTFEYGLRTRVGAAALELTTASEEFQQRYAYPNVEWADDGSYVLLWPKVGTGYVKLLRDGKYVFRHYIQDRGVMSLGQCR